MKSTWAEPGCTGVSEAGRTEGSSTATPLVSSKRGSFGTARGRLNVVGGLLSWIAGPRYKLIDLDAYLRSERGLARGPSYTISRSSAGFCTEVCSGGAAAPCKINQKDVTRYIEHHAQNWSPGTGKAMRWSLRAFLRSLHPRGLNARPSAGCVPSMRRWKLATLPTYLPAVQVRKALDGRDRKTVMGQRDYAILLLLAKLGLRADEVATLTLDDTDWRSNEILVRAKRRQRAGMLIQPDVGAAIVA